MLGLKNKYFLYKIKVHKLIQIYLLSKYAYTRLLKFLISE